MRKYATEFYFIKKQYQKDLEKITKGAYKKDHPVTTDPVETDSQGKVPFYHQPTYGNGPQDNPSKVLHGSKDLAGKTMPQNAVYPKKEDILQERILYDSIKVG